MNKTCFICGKELNDEKHSYYIIDGIVTELIGRGKIHGRRFNYEHVNNGEDDRAICVNCTNHNVLITKIIGYEECEVEDDEEW